jgi:hypothetical protein
MMTDNEKSLRKHLLTLLKGGEAHLEFDAAVKDMPAGLQGKRPKGAEHSPWEILEHIRIAQWDILEFTRNAKHVSPEFPKGYWPSAPAPTDEQAWDKSVKAFRSDLRAMMELVENESTDLFAKIPHGDGQTVLRQALLTADHNAYHLGQLVLLRRMLGAWQ